MDRTDEGLAAKLRMLLAHLDERQRRLLLGVEARGLGHGGIRRVARAAGVAEGTVSRGVAELDASACRPTPRLWRASSIPTATRVGVCHAAWPMVFSFGGLGGLTRVA
jgi:hypothetical protein